jgi:outer membrane lipoprotein LolB
VSARALGALGLAALLLAACASLQPVPEGETAEFELSGRIAVRYGAESSAGNVAWRHRGRSDELLITSSLGQGVARIVREGEAVTLTTAEPREYRAADAESLTEQVLGFRLPLSGLADWVRARPSGEAPALAQYAADGRLLALEQRGWRIEYLEYAGERPSRLRLTYPGIELRLAISEWK